MSRWTCLYSSIFVHSAVHSARVWAVLSYVYFVFFLISFLFLHHLLLLLLLVILFGSFAWNFVSLFTLSHGWIRFICDIIYLQYHLVTYILDEMPLMIIQIKIKPNQTKPNQTIANEEKKDIIIIRSDKKMCKWYIFFSFSRSLTPPVFLFYYFCFSARRLRGIFGFTSLLRQPK